MQAKYQRIISLAPNLTEMVYYLGAQDRLIAVTRYCDYPPAALQKPRIGGIQDVDLEAVLRLQPDLVLASYSGNSRETALRLQKLGIRVELFRADNLSDILTNLRQLAELLQTGPDTGIDSLHQKLSQLQFDPQGPRCLLLLSIDPFYSASVHSFLGESLQQAGLVNILRMKTPYPQLDRENILRHRPEVILLMDSLQPREEELRAILKSLGLQPRLIYVNEDAMSRPGPRLFDALLRLQAQLKTDTGQDCQD